MCILKSSDIADPNSKSIDIFKRWRWQNCNLSYEYIEWEMARSLSLFCFLECYIRGQRSDTILITKELQICVACIRIWCCHNITVVNYDLQPYNIFSKATNYRDGYFPLVCINKACMQNFRSGNSPLVPKWPLDDCLLKARLLLHTTN